MTVHKVAWCSPFYEGFKGDAHYANLGILGRSISGGEVLVAPMGVSGCYVEQNRNGCIQNLLDMNVDFDWVLWSDTDIACPNDALLRLLAHNKDIVGANYRQRIPPFSYVGAYLHGDTVRDEHGTPKSILNEPGLWPMAHLPTGLLLTRFSVYREMLRVETEIAQRRMAHYPAIVEYLREAGKLNPMDGGIEQAIWDLRERMVADPDPWFRAPRNKTEPRDDVYFCRRARQLGYEIWCDHDLTFEVIHDGQPWFNKDQIIEVQGAQLNIERHATETRERMQRSPRPPDEQARSAA